MTPVSEEPHPALGPGDSTRRGDTYKEVPHSVPGEAPRNTPDEVPRNAPTPISREYQSQRHMVISVLNHQTLTPQPPPGALLPGDVQC